MVRGKHSAKEDIEAELQLEIKGTVVEKRDRAVALGHALLECAGGIDLSLQVRAYQRIINLLGGEVEE